MTGYADAAGGRSAMSHSPSALRLAACGCGLLAALWAGPSAADPGARQVRLGAAPARPPLSKVIGALPAGTPIRVTVALKSRDPAALSAFASAVSTPGSDLYRQYLSVSQFARRFGA